VSSDHLGIRLSREFSVQLPVGGCWQFAGLPFPHREGERHLSGWKYDVGGMCVFGFAWRPGVAPNGRCAARLLRKMSFWLLTPSATFSLPWVHDHLNYNSEVMEPLLLRCLQYILSGTCVF